MPNLKFNNKIKINTESRGLNSWPFDKINSNFFLEKLISRLNVHALQSFVVKKSSQVRQTMIPVRAKLGVFIAKLVAARWLVPPKASQPRREVRQGL